MNFSDYQQMYSTSYQAQRLANSACANTKRVGTNILANNEAIAHIIRNALLTKHVPRNICSNMYNELNLTQKLAINKCSSGICNSLNTNISSCANTINSPITLLTKTTFTYNNSATSTVTTLNNVVSPFYINFTNMNTSANIPLNYYILCNIYYQYVLSKNAVNAYYTDITSPPTTVPAPSYSKIALQVTYNGISTYSVTSHVILNTMGTNDLTNQTTSYINSGIIPIVFTITSTKIQVQLSFPSSTIIHSGYTAIQYFASFSLEQSGGTNVGSASNTGIDNINNNQLFPNNNNLEGQYYLSLS